MSESRNRVRSIFLEAVEGHPPERRGAFLDAACGDDLELRGRVEALLEADGRPDSLLDGSSPKAPGSDTTTMAAPCPATDGPGTVVGPYKLMEVIGEGGMGVVYRAEQAHPVRRMVALKVIKPGMDSAQVLARFEAERQALALMDHPGIARVLDAGTTDAGRPYFVMELIRGVPITTYCDEVRLPHRERLGLFVQVCRAVQHAHQKGVVHRDLKPSNVMVAMVDGRPVPKVIDFGVAKAIDQRLTERTLFTQHGAVVGTLEYMSPEQAELSGLDVDTRSDVYALGVILYEMLTGSTPLERARLRQAAYSEILRRIKEEEPPRPSMRLSASGDRLSSLAAQRRTEPARLAKQVRGELDWIVMRALDKDRTRRYETASGFARDVERHLEGDPVEAGPPSASYKLRKLAGKHRAALATVAAFATVLLAAAAGGTYLAARAIAAERLASRRLAEVERANAATTHALAVATGAKDQARGEADKSRAINEFLTHDLLTQAEPEKNAAEDRVTLLEVLDRAAAKVGDRFRETPEVEEALRRALAGTYHGLASWEKAERQWRAVLESSQRRLGRESSDALKAQGELADILRHRGKVVEALALAKEADDGLSRTLGPDHPATLAGRLNLATAYRDAGRSAEAIALQEEALKRKEAELGIGHPDTLRWRINLASAYRDAGRTAEAIAMAERTLGLSVAEMGADHPTTLVSRNGLAAAYFDGGRTTEASRLFEENVTLSETRLGADDPRTLNGRNDLASAYLAAGRTAEAIALHEATLKRKEARLGVDHPDTLASRINLAPAYLSAGRIAEAIAMMEATLKMADASLGADHPTTLLARSHLATAYRSRGRSSQAIPLLEAVLAAQEAKLGAVHPHTLTTRSNLAGAYQGAGRPARAIALGEAVLAAQEAKLGADHPHTLTTRMNLANSSLAAGRKAEAVALDEATLRIAEAKLGPDHPHTLSCRTNLSWKYLKVGRPTEAIALLVPTLKLAEAKLGAHHPTTVITRGNLVGAYKDAGRPAEAVALLGEHLKLLEARLGPDHPDSLGTRKALIAAYKAAGQGDKAKALILPGMRDASMPNGPAAFAR